MAPAGTAVARVAVGASALALAWLPFAAEARCSKVDEPCLHTGCCSTPFSACYLKSDKKGEEAAFCRLGCEPGIHQDDPPKYQTPWSCKLLTFGCSVAYQPCEGAKGQDSNIVPCCQNGCMCNYTSKYFHQCVPPDGLSTCSEGGEEKVPDFARRKSERQASGGGDAKDGKKDKDADADSGEEEEEEEEEEESGGDCFKVGGVMMGPDCPQEEKAEVITDAGNLQAAGWQPSRLALALAGGSASACVIAAAAAMFLWRQSRIAVYERRDVELSISEDELS